MADKRCRMTNVREAIYWIIYGITIVSCLVVIAGLLLKLTNHSPTTLDVVLILQGANLAILAGLGYRFSEFKGKVEEWMAGHERKFGALATDFKASQTENRKMQADLTEIKQFITKRLH